MLISVDLDRMLTVWVSSDGGHWPRLSVPSCCLQGAYNTLLGLAYFRLKYGVS